MKKCDIIIPVYKSPEWVKLCIYSIFRNTDLDILNKVYLINDCDDELTINCLNNLANKYNKIELLKNDKNLGFIGTTNKGMRVSEADYILLLNTDCIISKGTVEKLISHLEKDKDIGLICPISSNAANLTLEMFDGFSYSQMNQLLENKFLGMNFDACTVVGNCLMITRECIKETGYLDEAYGMGYGEETDYQFKAMEKGFKAKVAIDTYVFHKAEVSFGTSPEKQARLKKNRDLFFERWGDKYQKLMKTYQQNDPIEYIKNNIDLKDRKIHFNFLIYLIGFTQTAGGVHMVVDMINYLVINGFPCNILYGFSNGYNEIMLFNPIEVTKLNNFSFDKIVSTIYISTYYAKKIADERKVPLLYFAQGYEPYFDNGNDYGIAQLSYKLADNVLTISSYLHDRYIDMFNINSDVISNGINYDLIHYKNTNDKIKTITILLRGNTLKGDFILLDLAVKLNKKYKNINIQILYNEKNIKLPFFYNLEKIKLFEGPFERKEIANILQKSDLYIDASMTEGFGLVALEAMAAGNVAIVSNSGGINEYITNNVNGYIVDNINQIDSYLEKVDLLINDDKKYNKMKKNAEVISKEFDYDNMILNYIDYFSKEVVKSNLKLTDEEQQLYQETLDKKFKIVVGKTPKGLMYKIFRLVPKSVRVSIKKFVEKLYYFTNVR